MQLGLRTRHDKLEEQPAVLPAACPMCDGPGYLDSINLVHDFKTQTCQSCGHRWDSPID
jgi:small neutral amino acid transporter SnatA (MarC family)